MHRDKIKMHDTHVLYIPTICYRTNYKCFYIVTPFFTNDFTSLSYTYTCACCIFFARYRVAVMSIEIFKDILRASLQTALSNLEEMQHNSMVYRSDNRSRSMGVGPMRSRPMEKRHDTSPYSGVPYLSPPPPDTWRRTNSDSALHQSANEACQSTSAIPHRRGSNACRFSFICKA